MASLPSQTSRRRSSPSSQSTSPAPQEPPSTSASNLQPILLNLQLATPSPSLTTPPQPIPSAEPRICWICQQDETEDPSTDIIWRTPCPCSLTAHDACLLEWIASEEAPKKGEIAHNHTINCPQCQAEIKIERPCDYLVSLADKIQRMGRMLIIPSALSGIAGCFYSGLLVYGMNTMQIVFGYEEARRVLGILHEERSMYFGGRAYRLVRDMLGWSFTAFDPFWPDTRGAANLKIFFGLPLIGPSLVISRTRFADQAFALLLPLYFLDPSHRGTNLTWPPTPGLTIATLPYIRTAYNELYRHTFYPYEQKWEAAVQRKPREGETAEEIAAQARAEEGGGDAIFELEFVHDHVHGDEVNFGGRAGRAQVGGNGDGHEDLGAQQEGAGNQNPDVAGAAAPAPNNGAGWEIRQDIPATQLLSTAMGALFFPTLASFMGELLKVSLPAKWVDKNIGLRIAGRNGLLKEKWGRTLVGGCLFVVLKDVVTLYCKWKKARDFGKRRVLDYMGRRGGVL